MGGERGAGMGERGERVREGIEGVRVLKGRPSPLSPCHARTRRQAPLLPVRKMHRYLCIPK